MLVLDNIRKAIGAHRARVLITGAAPISPDLLRWYTALGLEMVEVWGQTESGGISTANPIGRAKPGSIGKPLPQTEVKVSPEGELLVRSPSVFMGYLNQPEKTAETLRDGWLHTGDVGRMDNEGYFYITDRMKDIIITAGGKNITPSEIENQLKFSPYITDAVVIGDRRAYLTALIMIDHENVEKFAQDNSIPFSNYMSLCRRPEMLRADRGRNRQGEREVRPRREHPQVPPDRAEAHRRGRGTDPDDEAQAQAGEREIPRPDRADVRPGSGLAPQTRRLPGLHPVSKIAATVEGSRNARSMPQ